jgi:hypothetical protein
MERGLHLQISVVLRGRQHGRALSGTVFRSPRIVIAASVAHRKLVPQVLEPSGDRLLIGNLSLQRIGDPVE